MDRERVIKLAREAGYGDAMSDLHAPALERFATLTEREVRGDAEPVAYETKDELWWHDSPDMNDWIRKNGIPLYRHPAPAVVAQLVDALAGLIDFIEIDNLKIDQDALRIARAALAAAKENGL